jgi:hypothetical protein
MYAQSVALTKRIAALFNAGDIAPIADCVSYPLPIQTDGKLTLFRTREDLISALTHYRAQNVAQGFAPSRAQVVAVDLPRKGRFRLWVDWHYDTCDASQRPRTQNIYYCSIIDGQIKVDMVQYLRFAASGDLLQEPAKQRIA